jgi:predicted DNA-binding protein (UPF0251 family)
MEKVNELLNDIKSNLSQKSASQKDEVRVMRAMLNDRDYEVGVYGKSGKVGTFSPAKTARTVVASVMASAAKIPQAEAEKLADAHEFKKSEAAGMVEISKEFVNTFIQSGRKLPLGGREKSDVGLSLKVVEAGVRSYPRQVGVDSNGKPIYDGKGEVNVNAHESIRVHAPCPTWVR